MSGWDGTIRASFLNFVVTPQEYELIIYIGINYHIDIQDWQHPVASLNFHLDADINLFLDYIKMKGYIYQVIVENALFLWFQPLHVYSIGKTIAKVIELFN